MMLLLSDTHIIMAMLFIFAPLRLLHPQVVRDDLSSMPLLFRHVRVPDNLGNIHTARQRRGQKRSNLPRAYRVPTHYCFSPCCVAKIASQSAICQFTSCRLLLYLFTTTLPLNSESVGSQDGGGNQSNLEGRHHLYPDQQGIVFLAAIGDQCHAR